MEVGAGAIAYIGLLTVRDEAPDIHDSTNVETMSLRSYKWHTLVIEIAALLSRFWL